MTIERLDRNKPPPGYNHHGQDQLGNWIVVRGTEVIGHVGPRGISIMWEHYEARHDPPGTSIGYEVSEDGKRQTWGFFVGDSLVWRARNLPSRETARTAAWAWYWRRVEVADVLLFENLGEPQERRTREAAVASAVERGGPFWPRCLAWSDDQVAEVERWLGLGSERGWYQVPEVLRG